MNTSDKKNYHLLAISVVLGFFFGTYDVSSEEFLLTKTNCTLHFYTDNQAQETIFAPFVVDVSLDEFKEEFSLC